MFMELSQTSLEWKYYPFKLRTLKLRNFFSFASSTQKLRIHRKKMLLIDNSSLAI